MTIRSAYNNAQYPDRVFIGLCQQNHEKDIDCFKNSSRKNQIRNIKVSHMDAKGPTYARYLCSTLWKDEEYYFQIDSHMTFEKNWDSKIINMLKDCPGDINKNVLSHYPPDKNKTDNLASYMCSSKFKNKNNTSRVCINKKTRYSYNIPLCSSWNDFFEIKLLKKYHMTHIFLIYSMEKNIYYLLVYGQQDIHFTCQRKQ